jgi:hypothetical protein
MITCRRASNYKGFIASLSNRDTEWSPPSTMEELQEICNKQVNGDSAVCNGIFSSCDRVGLTYEECYAANFIEVNAEGIPSSVVESADRKVTMSLNAQAEATNEALYASIQYFLRSLCISK